MPKKRTPSICASCEPEAPGEDFRHASPPFICLAAACMSGARAALPLIVILAAAIVLSRNKKGVGISQRRLPFVSLSETDNFHESAPPDGNSHYGIEIIHNGRIYLCQKISSGLGELLKAGVRRGNHFFLLKVL